MLHRDPMLFHEAVDLWFFFFKFSGLSSPPPGGACSLLHGFSSPSRISLMFGRVASLLVVDEALAVPHMLSSFTGRDIDLVHVHGVGVPGWSGGSSGLSQRDEAVSPSSEFPELYHVLMELSCFVEPLFPFPAHLFQSFQ